MNKFLSPLPIMQPQGLAVIRIIVGMFLIYHGCEIFDKEIMQGYASWAQFKEMPSPIFIVYTGKAAELFAGILFTFGWLTRLAACVLILTMLYISFFVGHGKIWYDDQHPFLFVLLGFVFFFSGPGKWSIDSMGMNKNKNV
ncbi:MAG TPA: DoxX family protein [Chitinophagaceae bacterium]|jgi:putative oxidoreductase|nr:DoxX family protein [Chitinophagaceae bacterium]